MTRICIAVHNEMLAAALDTETCKEYYNPTETSIIRMKRYQAGRSLYPAWYLFGSAKKRITGLIQSYADQGFTVSVCTESYLAAACYQFDMLDVQLCTVNDFQYRMFSGTCILSGFIPESFSNKTVQAEQLFRQSRNQFLPVQKNYTSNSRPELPPAESRVWILKYPFGSSNHSPLGFPYTVWMVETIKTQLAFILSTLPAGEEIILSEFIHTDDPFAENADHVVHKMHFFSDASNGGALRPYGTCCQRFIYHCNRKKLERYGFLPLSIYTGHAHIAQGEVNSIQHFPEFTRQLNFFGPGRFILSIDFIVPTDGVPRYLESNKLGATFAEVFDRNLPPVIDAYPLLPL